MARRSAPHGIACRVGHLAKPAETVALNERDRKASRGMSHQRSVCLVKSLLHRLGISVRSANEPIDDEPTGALMGNVLAAFAQFDNDEKARRTKAGMKSALP